jgi:hypothetical protein
MLDEWHTRQTLQHFGQTAFHSGAFAGSHDDNVDRENGGGHGVQTFSEGQQFVNC